MLKEKHVRSLYLWFRDRGVDFGDGVKFPTESQLASAFLHHPDNSTTLAICLKLLQGEDKERLRRTCALIKFTKGGIKNEGDLKDFVNIATRVAEVLQEPLLSKYDPKAMEGIARDKRGEFFIKEWRVDGGKRVCKRVEAMRGDLMAAAEKYYKSRNVGGAITSAVYEFFTQYPTYQSKVLEYWRAEHIFAGTARRSEAALEHTAAHGQAAPHVNPNHLAKLILHESSGNARPTDQDPWPPASHAVVLRTGTPDQLGSKYLFPPVGIDLDSAGAQSQQLMVFDGQNYLLAVSNTQGILVWLKQVLINEITGHIDTTQASEMA